MLPLCSQNLQNLPIVCRQTYDAGFPAKVLADFNEIPLAKRILYGFANGVSSDALGEFYVYDSSD
ncbi:hypothetical protein BRYFOR_05888 [Marvinbryantia formatexigens DSM 14469]|uniref:Uncharacterized protein n=1 Tax=Marvinbryantia formatexigens DSM 14469 TaxID=478749 RepID=C6LB93_9FIRM|nr:hypothetical protein BRYFOR_05888 [Marvinbryantia formatexigens DSM 14469]